MLTRVGLFAVDSSRTRAYLEALARADLVPAHAIVLGGAEGEPSHLPAVPYFDNTRPARETLQRLGVSVEFAEGTDVNAPHVIEAVQRAPVDVFIYSGPGGAILRAPLLNTGKAFLHVHPGLVPQFRGSTTVYYSLLETGKCGASAMLLNEKIDEGPVLAVREYDAPQDRATLDHGYDPFIRADLLVRVLARYAVDGVFDRVAQEAGDDEPYYIMHPVLRHVVVLSRTW